MAKAEVRPKRGPKRGTWDQPPDRYPESPEGVLKEVSLGLLNLLPAFKARYASASQLAMILSITEQTQEISTADVGNVLQQLGAPAQFRGSNVFFDLESTLKILKSK